MLGGHLDGSKQRTETYNGNILVVEDDPFSCKVLHVNLTQEGYTVKTAENGRDGLQMLNEQAFDVVLLDLLMPKMDGFEVLKIMKADARLRHLPVIVISGEEDYLPCTQHYGNPVCIGSQPGDSSRHKLLRLSRGCFEQTEDRRVCEPRY
jgi:response regulator RpfG family c-di-GMP phosphodiesterase